MRSRWMGVVCLLTALFGCSKSPEPPKEKIIPVQVSLADKRDLPTFLETYGILAPALQAEARSQVGGRVVKVHFIEGMAVSKGDILAEIDPSLYRLKLQEAQSGVAQKKAQLEFAQKKLDRYLSLKQGSFAAVEYDGLHQDVFSLQASLLADEARCAMASLDLEHCTIRAPISGKMGKSSVQAESWVAAGANLGTLRNTDSLFVEFALSESELRHIGQMTPLEVRLPGEREEWKWKGALSALDNRIDPKSATVEARGAIGNEDHLLWPGQFVEIRLALGVEKDLLLLPIQAVQQNSQGKFVYIVNQHNEVSERPLVLGRQIDNEVIVLSGIGQEDRIVTKGQLRLYPNAKVEIKP